MKSANESLFDAYILRSILTERLANGYANTIIKEYKTILDDIIQRLQKNDVIDVSNMNRIIKELQSRITPNITLTDDMTQLATSEALFVQQAINTAATISIANRIPPDKILERIANAPLYMGSTIMETFSQFDEKLKFDLQAEIRQAVIQGEAIPQIKKRIVERFGVAGNQAESIARTATATLTNNVRMEVYKENEDIIKGYQHHSVLDSRTTKICGVRDGLKWNLEHNPIGGHSLPFRQPPLHPRCRSIMIPILKSYRELGLNIDEISGLTRSSLNGQVPSTTTFTSWFDGKDKAFQEKYLGRGRFDLYKSGKITLSNLIGKGGEPLTLRELNAKYAVAKEAVKVAKVIPKISFGYDGKFDKYVADIRDEAKIVIDKLPKPKNIINGTGYYNMNKNVLETSDSGFVFVHEYGHHLDTVMAGKSQTFSIASESMKTALNKDVELIGAKPKDIDKFITSFRDKYYSSYEAIGKTYYKRNSENVSAMADIIDSITAGKAFDKFGIDGHGKRYYKADIYKLAENQANLFTVWARDKELWEDTKMLFPNISNEFEKIMKDVADGKFD